MKTTFIAALFVLLPMIAFCETGVFVTNFPDKQITQDVNSIPNTITDDIVSETGKNVNINDILFQDKYTLKTDGYNSATISIIGTSRSDTKNCKIGVVLLPNEYYIMQAWYDNKVMMFPIIIDAPVGQYDRYFQGQKDISINFPSYVVGFYNTCGTNVSSRLIAYMKK